MLAEQVMKLVGKTGDDIVMEVEKGAIKRYADAVGDYNPLYWDEEYARKSGFDAIVAPPGFFGWPVRWDGPMPILVPLMAEMVDTIIKAGYGSLLDGGIDYEFLCPVRAGDVLTAIPRIASITEREGKSGKIVFSVIETTYTNQDDELVAKTRQTVINR